MSCVVLITQHYLGSKRKAGFHWLADAYWRAGYEVVFFTAYISWISWLRGNRRFPPSLLLQITREARRIKWVENRLASYVWFTPWHPANLRSDFLNRISKHWFTQYGQLPLGEATTYLQKASLVIFEPTPGLLLFHRLKAMNAEARYVYRVSDDLRLLRRHPVVMEAETLYGPHFDLVSAPSHYIYKRLSHLPNISLHYHGLNKTSYDEPCPTPYESGSKNAVFIGNSRFDYDFLTRASEMFPEWNFHIIGPISGLPKRNNVRAYGELPFSETVPYVKHADIGLHTLAYSPGAESFTDSLKVHQYTYCRLPIVAPEFLRSERNNVFYYYPGDNKSIYTALENATHFDHRAVSIRGIHSWDELARQLAGPVWKV